MWVDQEDFRGLWQRWEPATVGDWPSGDGVPEMCCEGILTRRKVHTDEPPETLSPELKARLEKIPRDKEGKVWHYVPFHDKHCLAKRTSHPPHTIPRSHVPGTGTDVPTMGRIDTSGRSVERIDGKARAAGEDAA